MDSLKYFKTTTQIAYGINGLKEVKTIIDEQQFQKVLIVTDKGISETGIIDSLLTHVKHIEYEIYNGCQPNPTVANCYEALNQLKEMEAEAIIAIGGGSSLDVAKAIALLATNGGKIESYEGIDTFSKDLLPLIAIPTTAGTASEITNFTVITDEEREYKFTIGGVRLAPKWAVIDPVVTLTLPPHITAATGLDALVHAIESYTSKMANFITKTLAREAIRKISSNLRQAVHNGNTLKYRDEMMMGSLLAGLAFNNTRLGNCHALSHPVSAIYHVPHGVANAILIPHVMKFNVPAVPELYADIAEDMGEILENLTLMEKAEKAVEAVSKLAQDIGIPTDFRSYNVDDSQLDKMTEDALLSGNIAVNPRVTKHDDVIYLYKQAIGGEQ